MQSFQLQVNPLNNEYAQCFCLGTSYVIVLWLIIHIEGVPRQLSGAGFFLYQEL